MSKTPPRQVLALFQRVLPAGQDRGITHPVKVVPIQKEALEAGVAPPVNLAATHISALEYVDLEVLRDVLDVGVPEPAGRSERELRLLPAEVLLLPRQRVLGRRVRAVVIQQSSVGCRSR